MNHDRKSAPPPLLGRRIGNGRAGILGVLHCLMDVFYCEVGSHDRLLMRRQRLADANQSSVRSSRYTGLPEVGVWGTERETMHALIERSQGVDIVADDLQ